MKASTTLQNIRVMEQRKTSMIDNIKQLSAPGYEPNDEVFGIKQNESDDAMGKLGRVEQRLEEEITRKWQKQANDKK
jgi:hypothetical protein